MNERWWIAAGRRAEIEAIAPLDLAAWMALTDAAEVLSTDRQSCAMRLGPLFIKWRHTLPHRRRKTLLRRSRERREAEHASRAHRLGIAGPTAWAFAERRQRGHLIGSLLIRAFNPHAVVTTKLFVCEPEAVGGLGHQLEGWHATGWRHGDAYPKNILRLSDGTTFAPIGYPSARFGGRPLDAEQVRDLAQVCIGLEHPSLGVDPEALLAGYLATAPFDRQALAAPLDAARQKILRKKADRRRTRPQREPQGPPLPRHDMPRRPADARTTVLELAER